MNQQLLKLALQAGLKKTHGSDQEYIGDFDWRLFSELIVKECSKVASDYDGAPYVGIAILNHFRVEK
jgi:hypothetical protein